MFQSGGGDFASSFPDVFEILEGKADAIQPSSHCTKELNTLRQNWTYAVLPVEQRNVTAGTFVPTEPKRLQVQAAAALKTAQVTPSASEATNIWLRACNLVVAATSIFEQNADAVSSAGLSSQEITAQIKAQLATELQEVPADFMTTHDTSAVLCTAILCNSPGAVAAVLAWLPAGHANSDDFALAQEHTTRAPWLKMMPLLSTPWHIIASVNCSTAISALLAAAAIPCSRFDADGSAALHVASREGHTAAVKAIVDTPGIEVDALSAGGISALLMAVQGAHAEAVGALLEAGADPWQSVHFSSSRPPEAGASPRLGLGPLALSISLSLADSRMFTLLLQAALARTPEWVLLTAPASAMPGQASEQDFEAQAKHAAQQYALSRAFLVEGQYNAPRHESLLCVAVRSGCPSPVAGLLDTVPAPIWQQALAEANLSTSLPLQLALQSQQPRLALQLLEAGFHPGPGEDLVLPAVQAEDEGLVQLLIDAGAELNTQHGTCPALAVCLQRDDVRMAKLLLAAGASPFSREAFQRYGWHQQPQPYPAHCGSPLGVWDPKTYPPPHVPQVLRLLLEGVPPGSVHPSQLPLAGDDMHAVKWSACTVAGTGPGEVPRERWRGVLEATAPPKHHNIFEDGNHDNEENTPQDWWGSVPPEHPMHLNNLRRLCMPLSDFFPLATVPFHLLQGASVALNADAISWALGSELDLFGPPENSRDLDMHSDPELHTTALVASLAGDRTAVLTAVSCGHGSYGSPERHHAEVLRQKANPGCQIAIYRPTPVTTRMCSGLELVIMPWLFRGDRSIIAELNAAERWWASLLELPPPDFTAEQRELLRVTRYDRARAAAEARKQGILTGTTPWVPRAELLVTTLRCLSSSAADAYAACERMAAGGLLQRSFPSLPPPSDISTMQNPFKWEVMFPRFIQQLIQALNAPHGAAAHGNWAGKSSSNWAVGALQWASERAGVCLSRADGVQLQQRHGRRAVQDLKWLRRRVFALMREKGGSLRSQGGGIAVDEQAGAAPLEVDSAAAVPPAALLWPAAYGRSGDSVALLLSRHSPQQWRLYLYTADGQRRIAHRRGSDGAVKVRFMSVPVTPGGTPDGLLALLADAPFLTPLAGSDLDEDLQLLQASTTNGADHCSMEL